MLNRDLIRARKNKFHLNQIMRPIFADFKIPRDFGREK